VSAGVISCSKQGYSPPRVRTRTLVQKFWKGLFSLGVSNKCTRGMTFENSCQRSGRTPKCFRCLYPPPYMYIYIRYACILLLIWHGKDSEMFQVFQMFLVHFWNICCNAKCFRCFKCFWFIFEISVVMLNVSGVSNVFGSFLQYLL